MVDRVKTCVYAISLNEIKHVDTFMAHCQGADFVLVCDTGSTDGTAERLRELGAVVYDIVQRPWRFDVPRNTALSLVPADIDVCLSIDLDEYLQPGWVEALDRAWQESNGTMTRVSYDYIWNWNADGTPATRFFADKIHHRQGYRWRHPCHETLYWEGTGQEIRKNVPDLVLHHRADVTKSRGQYLPLLKMAVDEDPSNDRMSHYYGRELMFKSRWQDAIDEFQRHLSLPNAQWREERCSSLRYISRCFLNMGKTDDAMIWAVKATQEWPWSREPWLELARCANRARDWATVFWAIHKCLAITQRGMTYISDGACWSSEPYDLGALAAYYLGLKPQAQEWGQKAIDLAPGDDRLRRNMEFYQE
jgi:glycosyltransferase involved in cell wall biosynthesis